MSRCDSQFAVRSALIGADPTSKPTSRRVASHVPRTVRVVRVVRVADDAEVPWRPSGAVAGGNARPKDVFLALKLGNIH